MLDILVTEVARRRQPGEPLYLAAAAVLHESHERLDATTREALEFIGWMMLKRHNTELSLPRVLNLIASGAKFVSGTAGGHVLEAEERSQLALLGLCSLADIATLRADEEARRAKEN